MTQIGSALPFVLATSFAAFVACSEGNRVDAPDTPAADSPAADTPATDSPAREIQIEAGEFVTCALDEAGSQLKCRGILSSCGDTECKAFPLESKVLGASSEHVVPFRRRLSGWRVSDSHGCAFDEVGTVWCWGPNVVGERGASGDVALGEPNAVELPLPVSAVAVGSGFSCALLVDGSVRCWGYNGMGQLGDGTTDGGPASRRVVGAADITGISASFSHACAWNAAGTVMCWGDNRGGASVPDGPDRLTVATAVEGVSARSVTTGYTHNCALTAAGEVYCWGRNTAGQLGMAEVADAVKPRKLDLPAAAADVLAGGGRTCAVLDRGEVFCWGANGFAQLGDGTTETRHAAVKILGWRPDSLALGRNHGCATKDGAFWCWGWNDFGAITGTTPRREDLGGDLRPLDSSLMKSPTLTAW